MVYARWVDGPPGTWRVHEQHAGDREAAKSIERHEPLAGAGLLAGAGVGHAAVAPLEGRGRNAGFGGGEGGQELGDRFYT